MSLLTIFYFIFYSCELYCPFGYVDQICYTKPIEPPKTYCVCPTDQMTCDQSIGCICKKGTFKIYFNLFLKKL